MRQWAMYMLLLCLSAVATVVGYQYIRGDWIIFRQAETFYSEKNFVQAAPLYERIVRNGFSHHNAHRHLAECYEKTGDSVDAISLYEQLSQKTPNDFWLQLELGGLYARHQCFLPASKAYRHALSLRPDNRMARIYLARTLTASEQFNEAIIEYRVLLGEKHDSE